MTDEQRERIHTITYSTDSRVELAERIVRLEDENAKLRKVMDFQALELDCMTNNRDVLHVENEKLRELVLHTVECVRRLNDTSENGGCVLCPYQSIDYDCDFESRARELGIDLME